MPSFSTPDADLKMAVMRGNTHLIAALEDSGECSQEGFSVALVMSALASNEKLVSHFLDKGADPKFDDSISLSMAGIAGNVRNLERLLAAGADPKARKSKALNNAARGGHIECVGMLAPISSYPLGGDSHIAIPAMNGRLDILRILVPFYIEQSETGLVEPLIIEAAAHQGHVECVEYLIPISDPSEHQSTALCAAARGGHAECVKKLFPLSNIVAAKASLYESLDFEALRLVEDVEQSLGLNSKHASKDRKPSSPL